MHRPRPFRSTSPSLATRTRPRTPARVPSLALVALATLAALVPLGGLTLLPAPAAVQLVPTRMEPIARADGFAVLASRQLGRWRSSRWRSSPKTSPGRP